MKLRVQLAIVCSTLLIIPWSGCEFLRANEQALLELQKQGLEATAKSIANGIADQRDLLYTDPVRATTPLIGESILAPHVPAPPVLDGYFDEWQSIYGRQYGFEPRTLTISAVTHGDRLYLALKAFDRSKNWNTAGIGREPTGDRVVLTTWPNGRRQQYVIATSAPGKVSAKVFGRQLRSADPDSIRGIWTDTAEGYQLELTLPLTVASSRLGIYYVDVDEGGLSTRGNMNSLSAEAPPWLIFAPDRLRQLIKKYDGGPIKLLVYDRWGWPLATSENSDIDATEESLALTHWLYRQILQEPKTDEAPLTLPGGRAQDAVITSALRGVGSHSLIEVNGELRSRFSAPIHSSDGVIGVLVTEQPRERYLSLSASAFEGLLFSGGLALTIVLASLASFAVYLSIRIQRLSKATFSSAGDSSNTQSCHLPVSRLNDELDQLAKHFQAQLAEQHRLQDYLRSLPSSLAHEIRTPIAIIRATLETLRDAELSAEDRNSLIERASKGLARLTRMLDAMNEANRLEASLGKEPFMAVDLEQLVGDLCAAYQQTFSTWRFVIDSGSFSALHKDTESDKNLIESRLDTVISALSGTNGSVPTTTNVAPDLLVQAMDKLVSNATSFSKIGASITLKLEHRGLWWRLSVINSGEPLPDDPSRLFAPMVSLRQKNPSEDGGNIGLGLYIVALVARHHGGEPFARNREDGNIEVGFTVRA